MHIMAVIGTRPEAIKMAPVVRALRSTDQAVKRVSVCLSGQHRALCDQVIRLFDIGVDHNLNIMDEDQTLFDVTRRVLDGMQHTLADDRPDVVLVHGDTGTSFAAALAAYYCRIPVGHVEAGLRTYNKYQPYPEEMNRRLTDALCDYHYAPTPGAKENLLRERIHEHGILVTGNTVIDALLHAAAQPCAAPVLDCLDPARRLIVATVHRRESFGAPMREICDALTALTERHTDLEIVLPVHPNPNVRTVIHERLSGRARILLTEPLEYLTFVHLLKRACLILTDSGGIQEEAPSLGKPVLVMRDVTERPEAIAAGTARLVGARRDAIVCAVETLLDDPESCAAMARATNPYGDGRAAERIASHLAGLNRDKGGWL